MSEQDIIFGRNAVQELLHTTRDINKIIFLKSSRDPKLQRLIDQAKSRNIIIQYKDRHHLDQWAVGENHQGVIALVAPFAYHEVETMLQTDHPLIIICDGITDPHNLGSIIRTANAVGANGVIIPKRGACPVNATVAKTSSGAIETTKVARVTNLVATMTSLKKRGVWIAGTDFSNQTMYQVDFTGSLAIVIGAEGKGISRLVKEHCDFLFTIPMYGNISSLNASVAASVAMYEALRQRTTL